MGQLLTGAANGLTPQNNFNASQATAGTQSQQQQLAALLLGQSQGQGPNPAQAAYQQNTDNAIKQNAGLVASQKGINPALATALASQNAGKASQAAAAQGAVQQASQELGQEGQVAGIYQNIGQEQLGASGQNAAVAAQNAAATQNTAGGLLNGLSGGLLYDGGVVKNYDDAGTVQPDKVPSVLSQIGDWLDKKTGNYVPPPPPLPTGGAGSDEGAKKLGEGWKANGFDDGGSIQDPSQQPPQASGSQQIANQIMQSAGIPVFAAGNSAARTPTGKSSKGLGMLKNIASSLGSQGSQATGSIAGGPMDAGGADAGAADVAMVAAAGGSVPPHIQEIMDIYHKDKAHMAPKKSLPPAKEMTKGPAQLKAAGGKVPGKAKFPDRNTPANDKVKTLLTPGEEVLPLSVMNSKDPAQAAYDFVANELKKRGKGSAKAYAGSPEGFKSALKDAIMSRKKAA